MSQAGDGLCSRNILAEALIVKRLVIRNWTAFQLKWISSKSCSITFGWIAQCFLPQIGSGRPLEHRTLRRLKTRSFPKGDLAVTGYTMDDSRFYLLALLSAEILRSTLRWTKNRRKKSRSKFRPVVAAVSSGLASVQGPAGAIQISPTSGCFGGRFRD